MSPAQLKKLQELSLVFSNGRATPQQIQQLSLLLAQINCNAGEQITPNDEANFNMPDNLVNVI